MEIRHEDRTLADSVTVAETPLSRMLGCRFRRGLPDGFAMVFPFGAPARRAVDMVLVPVPLDVCWLVDGRVERVRTLRPWLDFRWARADTIVEFPAGTAEGLSPGDPLELIPA